MVNILQDIIQSEEEALRIENEARQQALAIVAKARKKAETIIEEAFSQGEEITKAILDEAKAEALRERENNISVQKEASERIRMESGMKLEEAVRFIMGKVVDKSWQ
ncbi:MAG TPA: hypothetical protein GX501_08305 [Clostridiaceae bacterium]|nr:hypothetical protein [Clostridiaceae bacterium]